MTPTRDQLRDHLALVDALLKIEAETSLRRYMEQAWPILEPDVPCRPNWHIDYVAEHLEAVTAGTITRLLINLPPRTMKSSLVSVGWPTWEWIHKPESRWIFASLAEGLASKHSSDRRTLLQSPWYQTRWGHRVQLATDQNVKTEFANTRRGAMVATSIGGSITGRGGGRIVVDDPHNPMQVDSAVSLHAVREYFTRTLSTRLDDNKTGAVVVVMHRLHEQDLSALCRDLDTPTSVCRPKPRRGRDWCIPGRVAS
jgi:hypothetical protein